MNSNQPAANDARTTPLRQNVVTRELGKRFVITGDRVSNMCDRLCGFVFDYVDSPGAQTEALLYAETEETLGGESP